MLTMLNMSDCTCGRAPKHPMYHAEWCPLWIAYDKEARAIVDSIPVNINHVLKESPLTITITVTGIRFFRFRVWLGVMVIRLGVWVCGFNSVVVDGGGEQ